MTNQPVVLVIRVAWVAAVAGGSLDIAIVRHSEEAEGVSFEPLTTDTVRVVLPRHHRLARRKALSYSDLEGEPMVLWPRTYSHYGYDDIMRGCREAGFLPRIVQDSPSPARDHFLELARALTRARGAG